MNEPFARAIERVTVREFARRFEDLVNTRIPAFQRIEVTGEVSGWRVGANGFATFRLIDGDVQLSGRAFPDEAATFPSVKDGDQVVATGRIGLWIQASTYQLTAERIELLGAGAVRAQIAALARKLEGEGLFEVSRKRTVPRLPRHLALVSAKTGQGANDFLTQVGDRASNVRVTLVEAKLQGTGAAESIVDAIARASRLQVDAIVVLRGGGSFEDFLPFNTEPVARAIVGARHPVVTALGHTGDRQIADKVADAAYDTPTAAAEAMTAAWEEVQRRIRRAEDALDMQMRWAVKQAFQRSNDLRNRLDDVTKVYLGDVRDRLMQLDRHLDRVSPTDRLEGRDRRLAAAKAGLDRWPVTTLSALRNRLNRADERLDPGIESVATRYAHAVTVADARLDGVDPKKPLERGYAMVTYDGAMLSDASKVAADARIGIQLFRGSLKARVEEVLHEA